MPQAAYPGTVRTTLNVPLFGLAPGGVYHAAECYHRRGALLPHPFTLTSRNWRYTFCCTGRRLAPPRCYLAPCPVEPGLSSRKKIPSDCLADSVIKFTGFQTQSEIQSKIWNKKGRKIYVCDKACCQSYLSFSVF